MTMRSAFSRRALAAVLSLSLAACASSGGAGASAVDSDVINPSIFAPSLDIRLTEMTRTPSGLYIGEFAPGEGPPATPGDRLSVRYTLYLPDGRRVGGTSPDDPPFEFRLGNREVVAGWEEGLVGLRPGGRRRLIIPPRLGYGPRSRGEVPPNSVMVVDLRLVSISR
jgi:FKBP-type peptidyl-prolyl cis-trans isomerase